MAFDFPASPSTGQVYTPTNGPSYQWDGEKWKGGGQAREPDEQFFDLSGLTQNDIVVPTWAKGCKVEGIGWMAAGQNAIRMRLSTDGTTFFTGASDYNYGGPIHYTGSTGFATSGFSPLDFIPLTLPAGNVNIPHVVGAEMWLGRSDTSGVLGYTKVYGKSYDDAAATLGRTSFVAGYLNVTPIGSALAVKALRVFAAIGAFRAGSWLRVKWLGDTGQLQVGTSVPDAPADGGEYVRVNNVWRLKSQTVDYSGTIASDIPVPTGAKICKIGATLYIPSSAFIRALISFDGTTFLAGASDYTNAGHHFNTGSANVVQSAPALSSTFMLSIAGDNTGMPHIIDAQLALVRLASGQAISLSTYGRSLDSGATTGHRAWVAGGFMSNSAMGTNLAVKAIRINNSANAAFGSNSFINFEWIY